MNLERYLTQDDAATLSTIAERLLTERDANKFNTGEQLIELISAAILLPENAQKKDLVSLHSTVTYGRMDTEDRYSITIVCPPDANQTAARVSVFAPIAMALLGKKVGSIVEVELPYSQVLRFQILGVTHPSSINEGSQARSGAN